MTDKGLTIETESFSIIERSLKGLHPPECLPVVKRVIHATGDFEYEHLLRFHPMAVARGIEAVKAGRHILVDVGMVQVGINRRLLERFGCKVICNINDPLAERLANKYNLTRAEAAIDMAVSCSQQVGIVVVGNAPTALLRTMELIDRGMFCPELVIGVPVGFVKAKESKEALCQKRYPFITCTGTKGGSSVAVAIMNAILIMASEV